MSEPNENDVGRRSSRLVEGELESATEPHRLAQQARRLRLGHAALAEAMAWARSSGARCCRRSTTSSSRSAPSGAAATGPRILASVTLLEHASDAVKQRFLRRIITGEDGWCQLFSEPGSGSDLAGATTRADFDGKQWIVNGQKVWNTSAHHADYGLLVARTDWDAPKHQGLTYFVLDMRQPGVQVLPLKQMNGHASFNQVFFTDAKIPADWIVGAKNNGWAVAMTTLAHERRPAVGVAGVSGEGRTGRAYDRSAHRSRNRQRAVQVVSATRRTRRSRGAAREENRRMDRSGDPSGNRQAADDVAQHELDGAPRGRSATHRQDRRVRKVRSANSPAATSRARHRTCTR